MNDIFFDKVGEILQRSQQNWFIKIKNDKEISGGFYVFISNTRSFEDIVYDDWLENEEDLKQYILENNWKIKWKK